MIEWECAMKCRQMSVGLMLALLSLAQPAAAVERIDLGRQEYRANCLNCHGETGDGNGPYAHLLNRSASDLTRLSKGNGGRAFALERHSCYVMPLRFC